MADSELGFSPGVALVVVDVQNDFVDPSGSLSVAGAQDVIPKVNGMVEAATDSGAFVVYTQDWHPPTTPHFAKDGGTWPVHCVADTWGAEMHPDLAVVGPIVKKGSNGEDGYSGFTMRDPVSGETIPTQLAGLLDARGTTDVVIVGLALDYCVKETALDSARLGYVTTVPLEATRPVDLQEGDGERAIQEMLDVGCLMGSS